MTSREDVERLSEASKRVVNLANLRLAQFYGSLPDDDPAALTEALEQFVPALVAEYGDLAAEVAAEWYDEVRARSAERDGIDQADVPEYRAEPAEGAPRESVERSTRWAAHPDYDTQALLRGIVQRGVSFSVRETIAANAVRDPMKPRYARVPTGGKTCSFCEMLASRGFVYLDEGTASTRRSDLHDYHDNCNCVAVAMFSKEHRQAQLDGYDPEAMYRRYAAARDQVGTDDPAGIAKKMRELFPDQYTDGADPYSIDSLSDDEADAYAMKLMEQGDFVGAERVSELLEERLESTYNANRADPMREEVYEWYDGLDPYDQQRFYESIPEELGHYFLQEHHTWKTGRVSRGTEFTQRELRAQYDEYLDREIQALENFTNGNILSRQAQAEGRHPRDLFKTNEATARAWMSDDAAIYFDEVGGRMTWNAFKASAEGDVDTALQAAGAYFA